MVKAICWTDAEKELLLKLCADGVPLLTVVKRVEELSGRVIGATTIQRFIKRFGIVRPPPSAVRNTYNVRQYNWTQKELDQIRDLVIQDYSAAAILHTIRKGSIGAIGNLIRKNGWNQLPKKANPKGEGGRVTKASFKDVLPPEKRPHGNSENTEGRRVAMRLRKQAYALGLTVTIVTHHWS